MKGSWPSRFLLLLCKGQRITGYEERLKTLEEELKKLKEDLFPLRERVGRISQNNSIIKDRTMSIKVFSLEIGLVGVYKRLQALKSMRKKSKRL